MYFVTFLLILIGVMVEEAALGWPVVVPLIVALALRFDKAQRIFAFAFVAGVLADLVSGRLLGFSALLYLGTAGITVMFSERLTQRRLTITSIFIGTMTAVSLWLLGREVTIGQLLFGIVIFWLLVPVIGRLGELGERGEPLRLKPQ